VTFLLDLVRILNLKTEGLINIVKLFFLFQTFFFQFIMRKGSIILILSVLFNQINGQQMELVAGHVVSGSRKKDNNISRYFSYFDMETEHLMPHIQRIQ
jgi:hypothetical protein